MANACLEIEGMERIMRKRARRAADANLPSAWQSREWEEKDGSEKKHSRVRDNTTTQEGRWEKENGPMGRNMSFLFIQMPKCCRHGTMSLSAWQWCAKRPGTCTCRDRRDEGVLEYVEDRF